MVLKLPLQLEAVFANREAALCLITALTSVELPPHFGLGFNQKEAVTVSFGNLVAKIAKSRHLILTVFISDTIFKRITMFQQLLAS